MKTHITFQRHRKAVSVDWLRVKMPDMYEISWHKTDTGLTPSHAANHWSALSGVTLADDDSTTAAKNRRSTVTTIGKRQA